MIKKHKIPLVIVSSLFVAAPVALVVSCSNNELKKNEFNTYLVTDGSINDNAVNQMSADALASILGVESISTSDYISTNSNFVSSYESLENIGAKYVIASGEKQAQSINDYFVQNPDSKLNFILVDGDYNSQNFAKADQVTSIKYDVKQPAFLAGVLTSKYLSSIDDTTPKVGVFAKDDNQTSHDYIEGFLSGIKYMNNQSATDTDVELVEFEDQSSYTNGKIQENLDYLFENQTDVILPVVGNKIYDVVDILSTNYDALDNNTKIIGTDIDQSTLFPDNEKSLFLTSIEKKVHKSILDVYRKVVNSDQENSRQITGPTPDVTIAGLGQITTGNLDNSLVKISTPINSDVFNLYKEITGVNGVNTYLNASKVPQNYVGYDSSVADVADATAEQQVIDSNQNTVYEASTTETMNPAPAGTPLTDEIARKFGITMKPGFEYSYETQGFNAQSTNFDITFTVTKNGHGSTTQPSVHSTTILRLLSPDEVELADVFAEYDRVVALLKANTVYFIDGVPRHDDQHGGTYGWVRLNGPETIIGSRGTIFSCPPLVDALGLTDQLNDNYYYDIWLENYTVGQIPTFYLIVTLKSDYLPNFMGPEKDGASLSGKKLNTSNIDTGRAESGNVSFSGGSAVIARPAH